ncbi:MAG: hypothetical protein ACKESB_02070 [Candidatus Hodgkinia cicadicola]
MRWGVRNLPLLKLVCTGVRMLVLKVWFELAAAVKPRCVGRQVAR